MKNYILDFCFRSRSKALFLFLAFALSNPFGLHASETTTSSEQILKKQAYVVRLYEKKRYNRALEEIELLLPLLKNRIDHAKFELYKAYCNFYEKRYLVSQDQFHLFIKQYPAFPQVEEAIFMRGCSLAYENPDIRLDQSTTYNATNCLQHYLDTYPSGVYVDRAQEILQGLAERLIKKSFEAAALYVPLGYYHAAIVALRNFQQTYPNSFLDKQVFELLIKCYKKLAAAASDSEQKKVMKKHIRQTEQDMAKCMNTKKTTTN